MGQVECKRCSIGTFVSVQDFPGTSVSDCLACPYGKKLTNWPGDTGISKGQLFGTVAELKSHAHE